MDEDYMKAALEEAQKAYDAGEVPVGALVVFQDQIISRAYNQVESLQDASAHAELLCLRKAAEKLGNWRLVDCTLYSTLEPCLMCSGAAILSRVGTLVWGAADFRHGACGSLMNVFTLDHPIHQVKVRQLVLQEECGQLLKKFLNCAERIIPHITEDDLLQPNDFPPLEGNPHFRYEEGILEGLMTARMAYLARAKERDCI